MLLLFLSLFYATDQTPQGHPDYRESPDQRTVLQGIMYAGSTQWQLWTSAGTITPEQAPQHRITGVSGNQVCFQGHDKCIKTGDIFPF